jgi:hypothetical protein
MTDQFPTRQAAAIPGRSRRGAVVNHPARTAGPGSARGMITVEPAPAILTP